MKVTYGMTIRLRHSMTKRLLKSLGRNFASPSISGQQIVGGTTDETDIQTNWLIKGPNDTTSAYKNGQDIVSGSAIRLEHVETKKNLHSHPINDGHLAPVTRDGAHQEVTAYGSNGVGDENDDWVVQTTGTDWWEFGKDVRIYHRKTGRPLHSHHASHPEITGGLQEVTAYLGEDANDYWLALQSVETMPVHFSPSSTSVTVTQQHLTTKHSEPADESSTGIHPVFDYVTRNWKTLKQAPLFFLVVFIAGGLVSYWLSGQFYTGTIREKDATIQRLSLRPESIPAQEQELKELRAELTKLKAESAHFITDGGTVPVPDLAPLDEQQSVEWARILSKSGLKVITVYWGQEVNARPFYLSLKRICENITIDVRAGSGNTARGQIDIVARNDEPGGRALEQLFDKLAPTSSHRVTLQNPATGSPWPIGEVSVFIGEKR